MSVSTKYLGRIAKNVLNFLDEKRITYFHLNPIIMDKTFPIDENKGEVISIESRPSNLNTLARTLSYKIENVGIPLEVRANEELGYSKIIVKGKFAIPGYTPFAQDVFGNTGQDKKVNSTDISQLKAELEKSASL